MLGMGFISVCFVCLGFLFFNWREENKEGKIKRGRGGNLEEGTTEMPETCISKWVVAA